MNQFLDRHKPVAITQNGLPHWEQSGKLQFVTFRTYGSLPKEVISRIKEELEESIKTEEHSKKLFLTLEKYLDNGNNSCLLMEENIRKIVEETLFYFDDVRYEIHAFAIMPNHVHLLLATLEQNKIAEIIKSLKRYSASQINQLLNHEGAIWQQGYFDRIIRNEQNYEEILSYIEQNPRNCKKGTFSLYIKNKLHVS